MRARRYEHRDRIQIAAPIARVFAVASDPEMVPRYAGEVRRIETLSVDSRGGREVLSHIRMAGMTVRFRYRYRYSPPHFYGGVQRGGGPVRGYFTMRFHAIGEDATEVEHVEGIVSGVPMLARIVGWLWFNVLSPDGVDDELLKLKTLVEQSRNLELVAPLTPPRPPVPSASS